MSTENLPKSVVSVDENQQYARVETSAVTQKITKLLSDEARIESLEDLNFVVEHHSPLLHEDRIIPLVQSIPAALAELPQTRFLQGVVLYHLQHKKEDKEKDWASAYEKFAALLPEAEAGGFLGFYIPNYCFLSLRNHNKHDPLLKEFFEKAKQGAERMEEPIRSQLLGFILYNYGRLLLSQNAVLAVEKYIEAGRARIRFYESIKSTADEIELLSAATQVWKIREEWERSLPHCNIYFCTVSQELFDEVAKLSDPKFANKKS